MSTPPPLERFSTACACRRGRGRKPPSAACYNCAPKPRDGSEGCEIVRPIRGQPKTFTAINYLPLFALPNFFFHVTTAYAILRHNGLEIGKGDFVGALD